MPLTARRAEAPDQTRRQTPRAEYRRMPQRTSPSAPFERSLKRIGDQFTAQITAINNRMDTIETRLAQGQHDNAAEVQGMFAELQTTFGGTRDEVAKLAETVSRLGEWRASLEQREATEVAVKAAVKAALEDRDRRDGDMAEAGAKSAMKSIRWKPVSLPTLGVMAATIGAVFAAVANAKPVFLLVGRLLKAVWDAVVGR